MAPCVVSVIGVLLLVLVISKGEDSSYQLHYDASKDTLSSITSEADYSAQQAKLLSSYSGDKSAECKEQLYKKKWDSELQKKVAGYKSQVEYTDKLVVMDVEGCAKGDHSCVDNAVSKGSRDLAALKEKAARTIVRLKSKVIEQQKAFMDQCVQ